MVICRTDDRRPLGLRERAPTSYGIIKELYDAKNIDKPYWEKHRDLHLVAKKKGKAPSAISNLLVRIRQLNPRRAGPIIDSSGRLDAPENMSVESAFRLFKAARRAQDYPQGLAALKVVAANCHISFLRRQCLEIDAASDRGGRE